jgi:dihydroorotase
MYICSLVNILIKNVTIICPNNPHHLKKRDVLIEKGIYKNIASKIAPPPKSKIISEPNAYLSVGWVDVFSNFCEPGYENNETLYTGIQAAAAGGYTDVALIPNTHPCTDNNAQVQFLKNKNQLVNLHPLGAISKKTEGKNLAEMMDMHQHGAVAFTDGEHAVQDAGLMLKALQYVKALDCTIIQLPNVSTLSANTYMHEGNVSTQLGLAGQSEIAEIIMIQRDIELLRYTNSKLHITGVSSAKSIELIRKAKKEGLQITCSCTPHHLLFTENNLINYDSNFKVNPPLRTLADKKSLIKALLDGTIDAIASHHSPADWDGKNVEFEYAAQGMSTIETVFHSLLQLPELENKIELVVSLLCAGRNILQLPAFNIAVGEPCNATLFSTESGKVEYNNATKKSMGTNNVHLNSLLKGKIIATFNNYKNSINE